MTDIELSGEIDIGNVWLLAASLARTPVDRDVVIDASDLAFIDVKGCRTLVEFAERLGSECNLVINTPPGLLPKVLALSRLGEAAKIVLQRRETEQP